MHIQSRFWSSTGANLFCGIRWLCIFLPSAPNSWNTLQVLLAVKHPVQNTSDTEQLHSHPAVPGETTCTRSCLALCPRFLPASGRTSVSVWWWLALCVRTHERVHVLVAWWRCFERERRGRIKVFSPRWRSQLEQCKGFGVTMKIWLIFSSWENVNDILFNSSLLFRFTKPTSFLHGVASCSCKNGLALKSNFQVSCLDVTSILSH